MAALAIAQDEKGWLVAGDDGLRRAAISACRRSPSTRSRRSTTMYNLKPTGQLQDHDLHQPAVRAAGRGRGGRAPEGEARHRLRRDDRRTALFTLKEGECFGACGDAPVLLVNNKRMLQLDGPESSTRCSPSSGRRGEVAATDERAVEFARLRTRRDHHDGPRPAATGGSPTTSTRGGYEALKKILAEKIPPDDGRSPRSRSRRCAGAAARAFRPASSGASCRSSSRATSTWSAIPTRASPARSRTATSCATTRMR